MIQVDRAADDLRRGMPVELVGSGGSFLVLAVETATRPGRALFDARRAGAEALVLTHPRARTLKIHLYTPEVVILDAPAGDAAARAAGRPSGDGTWDWDLARALADPCRDLDTPLKGPFAARRTRLSGAAEAVRLAKIAGLLPAIMVAPRAARGDGAEILTVAADAIAAYDGAAATSLQPVVTARVPLDGAEDARLTAFRPLDGGPEHIAIVIGAPDPRTPVLVRLHSECFTGDLIGSLKCDCGEQLRGAIAAIAAAGGGVLLYLAQEGRGIGLINKLRAYRLQDQGFDTVEANERLGFDADERVFLPAARMLRALGFDRIRLMTNNPDKVAGLSAHGIGVVERVAHAFPANPHNAFYLSVKRAKSGHLL